MPRSRRRLRWAVLAALAPALIVWFRVPGQPPVDEAATGGVFLARPYLQLGDHPAPTDPEWLALLWHAPDADASWAVEVATTPGGSWEAMAAPSFRRIAGEGIAPHRVYRATLSGLTPGAAFAYRVLRGRSVVFAAGGRARKPPGRPQRFAVFADCAAGTPGQRAIAYQTSRADPDYVVIPGDIVYMQGRVDEYRRQFFPVYNADRADPTGGAPLIRSIPFLAVPGNHDTVNSDLDKCKGGLAYFYYWDQPLNGPPLAVGGPNAVNLRGAEPTRRAFLDAAGPAFPRMASFSFDYGDAHWTLIDGNTYADWSKPALRDWIERDLAAARGATWRFVAVHQAPFHSTKAHADDQRLRLLSGVFEAGGVDIVFGGHVHNYQRSYPLRFAPRANAAGKLVDAQGRVEGRWTLDKAFDGRARTRPEGVIHLVTGAGGARLYDTDRFADHAKWQEFTQVYVADVNSLTVAELSGTTLTVRQVAADGRELDRFTITKPDPGGPPGS